MKKHLTLLCILASLGAQAQDSTKAPTQSLLTRSATSVRHVTTASMAPGFIDEYRTNYTVPAGFEKKTTTGFTVFYGKLEYGITRHISIGALISYDRFYYNFNQLYTGNNGPFVRYRTNTARIFTEGIAGFYHFNGLLSNRRFDPYIGAGLVIHNIRYSAYPQGDSTATRTDHVAAPYIKAGIRYYISDKFSIMGDVGYDKQSIFSIGFSCRFFPRKMVK